MTAFQTVLEEEIDFPVPATLLGNPVVVTGLVGDDARFELRARCEGRHGKGKVSFSDLEFLPGTVEAWLHAAYVAYLGRPPSAVTPTVRLGRSAPLAVLSHCWPSNLIRPGRIGSIPFTTLRIVSSERHLTLTFLRAKHENTQRRLRRPMVDCPITALADGLSLPPISRARLAAAAVPLLGCGGWHRGSRAPR